MTTTTIIIIITIAQLYFYVLLMLECMNFTKQIIVRVLQTLILDIHVHLSCL
jgi:hypothetical protein